MQLILQSDPTAALRRVAVFLVDSAGAPVIGVTSPTLAFTINGAAFVPAVVPTWTEVGGGMYYLELLLAHVATLGYLSIVISHSGVATQVKVVQIVAFDPNSSPPFPDTTVRKWGLSATSVADSTAAVDNAYRAQVTVAFAQPIPTNDAWTIVLVDKAGPVISGVSGVTISLKNRFGAVVLGATP